MKIKDRCHIDHDTGKIECKSETQSSWHIPAMLTAFFVILLIWSYFIDTNIQREFDADYLLFDLIFLLAFSLALVLKKKFLPLCIGILFGAAIFVIDGVIWWYTGVRQIDAPFSKWYVDFMMDFSYGVAAFSCMIIALRKDKDAIWWTLALFGGWLMVAGLSEWIPLDDTTITTAREMESLHLYGILAAIAGYWILYFMKYDNETILYIFGIACVQGFVMEFYLWVFQIRPSGLDVVAFDTFVLINQGMPYIFIILYKIIPTATKKMNDYRLSSFSIID